MFVCLFIYFLNPFDPLRVKFSRRHLLDWRVNSASNWLKKCCRHACQPNFPAESELLNLYYKCLGKVKMKQMSIHILFLILILFLKGPFLKRQNRLNNIFFEIWNYQREKVQGIYLNLLCTQMSFFYPNFLLMGILIEIYWNINFHSRSLFK